MIANLLKPSIVKQYLEPTRKTWKSSQDQVSYPEKQNQDFLSSGPSNIKQRSAFKAMLS